MIGQRSFKQGTMIGQCGIGGIFEEIRSEEKSAQGWRNFTEIGDGTEIKKMEGGATEGSEGEKNPEEKLWKKPRISGKNPQLSVRRRFWSGPFLIKA